MIYCVDYFWALSRCSIDDVEDIYNGKDDGREAREACGRLLVM